MVAKKSDTKKEGMGIPLEWHFPDGMITPLAFNMTIQLMEDVFKISFFEVKPPFLADESMPRPITVRADCVASIFVTPERLSTFIDVLQTNFDKYKASMQKK